MPDNTPVFASEQEALEAAVEALQTLVDLFENPPACTECGAAEGEPCDPDCT